MNGICITTLFHLIDSSMMKTRNLDLLERLSPHTKKHVNTTQRNKCILGQSIEEYPKEIGTRESFGYWEIYTVIESLS